MVIRVGVKWRLGQQQFDTNFSLVQICGRINFEAEELVH